jgi:predicted DNA-binding transcriptional regulator YafY
MSTDTTEKKVSEQATQTERLAWLHEQLKGGKHPNHDALAEHFAIKPSVAYRDFDMLKYIFKAPLKYDYDKGGYAYAKKFELPKTQLKAGEMTSLLVLDHLRRAYTQTDLEPLIGNALKLLIDSMKDAVTIDYNSLDQILQVEIDPLPQIDIGIFQQLLQAIGNRESIIIRYFSGQKAVVVEKPCDPYHLLNFKDNWYLVAFCHEKQDYRDFLCSRIMSVEHTNVTFLPDPDFSLEAHKRDSQLFAAEAPSVEIVAEFDKYAAHWIRLKKVHPSQEVLERSDGSLEVSFRVSSMENIMRWILSFGEHARILAPLELQERVRRTIGRMNYLYNRF